MTVVDTPGFNEDLEAEEETIDQIVNFLRNDLQYVHAFILTFKVLETGYYVPFKVV